MSQSPPSRARFPSTRWSLVLEAKDEESAVRAMEELSRLYWLPLYAFARRNGLDSEDAEDLTQEFFLKLVEERARLLRNLDPAHGRLRTFFLTVMRRRIADWRRHRMRRKRGGGQSPLGIEAAESLLADQGTSELSPEASYDRQWAFAVLDLALSRLERDYAALGREGDFTLLRPFLGLSDAAVPDYGLVTAHFEVTPETARQKVHRFRDRFRAALRSEIAETLHAPDEAAVDRELRDLQDALR